MQVGWSKSPPRVVRIVGRQGGGAACVFALWCMGTLALTSSIRSPQVAAADEEKGGEEETAGAEGAAPQEGGVGARGVCLWPLSAVFRNRHSGHLDVGALFRNIPTFFCAALWCSGTGTKTAKARSLCPCSRRKARRLRSLMSRCCDKCYSVAARPVAPRPPRPAPSPAPPA